MYNRQSKQRESKGRRKLRQSLAQKGVRLNSRVADSQTYVSDDNDDDDEDYYEEGEREAERNARGNRDNEIDAETDRIKLTGESPKISYELYHDILQTDLSIKEWGPEDDDRLSSVFWDFDEDVSNIDEPVLVRMRQNLPRWLQDLRRHFSKECLTDIFGTNQDLDTINGRLFYHAIKRFHELDRIKYQESVLFTLVAGCLLRQVTQDDEALHQEQIDEPATTRSENVWNFRTFDGDNVEGNPPKPHPVVYAAFLWAARDPTVFIVDTLARGPIALDRPPTARNYENILTNWAKGDWRVNAQVLLNLRVPLTGFANKPWMCSVSKTHGGWVLDKDRRYNFSAFLKGDWSDEPAYKTLRWHVEEHLFFAVRRRHSLPITDAEDALLMNRAAADYMRVNPLLMPYIPSPDKRLDLWAESDPIREKYERTRQAELIQEAAQKVREANDAKLARAAGLNGSAQTGSEYTSQARSAQGGAGYTSPHAVDATRRLFTEATAPATAGNGSVTFRSLAELNQYMNANRSSSPALPGVATMGHPSTILTVPAKQLRGPDPGEKFGPRETAQIRPFKDFLEQHGCIIDSADYYEVRNVRVDQAWSAQLDNIILFDHAPGYWRTLGHVEFFRVLTTHLSKADDPTRSQDYAERVGEWIDKELSVTAHKNQLWTGVWTNDLKVWQQVMTQYLAVRAVTQPDNSLLIPDSETQIALLKRLRRLLYTKAEYFKSRELPQFFNFLLDIDDEIDRRRCSGSTSSHQPTRLAKPTGHDSPHSLAATVLDYIKTALQVGKHINDTVFAQAGQYSTFFSTVSAAPTVPTVPNKIRRERQERRSPNKVNDSAAASKEKELKTASKGSGSKPTPQDKDEEEGEEDEQTGKGEPTQPNQLPKCKGCGKKHPPGCFLGPDKANHPDWNNTELEWKVSPNGIAWGKKQKHYLPSNQSLNDPTWTNPHVKSQKGEESKDKGKKRSNSFSKNKEQRERDKASKKTKPCKYHIELPVDDKVRSDQESPAGIAWQPTYLCTTMSPKTLKRHSYLLTCRISLPNHTHVHDTELECLVDTGALDRNYVSREVAELLAQAGGKMKECDVEQICSCNQSVCMACLGIVSFDFTFYNELTKHNETLGLEATVIDMDFDVIIGRRDIYKHDVILKVYRQIFSDLSTSDDNALSLEERLRNTKRLLTITTHSERPNISRSGGGTHTSLQKNIKSQMTTIPKEIVYLNTSEVKRKITKKEQYLTGCTGVEGDEELFDDDDEDWNPFDKNKPKGDCYVTGSPQLQREVRKLIEEYKDIFSASLTEQPALVPPI